MVREKRKSNRIKISINISYLIYKTMMREEYSYNWVKCELYDISENGISLKINQTMLLEDHIKLKIVTLKDHQIIDAIIKNVNGQRVGAKFIDMNSIKIDFLSRTISDSVFNNRMLRAVMY